MNEQANRPDQFHFWSTADLLGIARRVTPSRELDSWVATADDRSWRAGRDELGPTFDQMERNHTTGAMDVVRTLTDEDLREFVVEQIEHYGITITDVNYMKS